MKRRTLLAGASVMPVGFRPKKWMRRKPQKAGKTGRNPLRRKMLRLPCRDVAALQKTAWRDRGRGASGRLRHSWTGLVPCDGAIGEVDHFNGIMVDEQAQTAWLAAGARLS